MNEVFNPGRWISKAIRGRTPVRARVDMLSSLLAMAWVVEARDPYTGGHLWRVSQLARLLALKSGLPDADVSRIAIGGFLHDLGKVAVPDHILRKPDRLTDEEYDVIKTHPNVGWRMLAGHPLANLAEAAIRAHHETPDGRGYPNGLSDEAIPADARIVGICDAFDAMTSSRPYRRGMPVEKALGIIEENLGRQFDAGFGARFVALGREGAFDHIVGHSDDGIPLHTCVGCGPIIVLKRHQRAGSKVFCPACGGAYAVETGPRGAAIAPAEGKAQPRDLEPEPDVELIAAIIRESANALLT